MAAKTAAADPPADPTVDPAADPEPADPQPADPAVLFFGFVDVAVEPVMDTIVPGGCDTPRNTNNNNVNR